MTPSKAPLRVVQAVGVGSACLSASYFAGWAPSWPYAIGLFAFAFSIDLAKPLFFTACAQALRDGKVLASIVPGLVGALLFAVSMLAIDGMLIKLRSDAGSGRANTITKVDDARAAETRLEAELKKLGPVQPSAALEARVQTSVEPAVWTRTRQCTDVTQKNSQAACAPAFKVREQIAIAKQAEKLQAELDEARHVLKSTERPNAADPQLASMSKVTGWSEDALTLLLMLIVGLAIDLVASLGPAYLTPPAPPAAEVEAKPEAPVLTTEQKALQWVLDELAKSPEGKVIIMNQAIAARFDVDPATVTRWRAKWVDAGLLRETRTGRQITVKIARRAANG
jgi:hypothetical protein